MAGAVVLEDTLRRDRLWVLAALAVVTLLAWAYLVDMAAGMDAGRAGMALAPWTPGHAAMILLMWVVMMVGMMVPSAAPVILLHARVCRRRAGRVAPTGAFLLGYVVAWALFSVGATAWQWALAALALFSPAMAASSPVFGAAVLTAAGVYQLTPWKNACLTHCRSPMDYLARRWRNGAGGALRMGIEHGAYCVGCCWILMAILFVVGVMDLFWVAAITGFVLAEKVAPAGWLVARVAALGLIVAGLVLPFTA